MLQFSAVFSEFLWKLPQGSIFHVVFLTCLECIDLMNNFHFLFQRRCKELAAKGMLYVGSGVSGGEDGARYGPSLMPGGSPEAW